MAIVLIEPTSGTAPNSSAASRSMTDHMFLRRPAESCCTISGDWRSSIASFSCMYISVTCMCDMPVM
jgi:hypothetical protein